MFARNLEKAIGALATIAWADEYKNLRVANADTPRTPRRRWRTAPKGSV